MGRVSRGGGKGPQMTSTAGNQTDEGEETQGRQVERITNRKRRKIKKTHIRLKDNKNKIVIQLISSE